MPAIDAYMQSECKCTPEVVHIKRIKMDDHQEDEIMTNGTERALNLGSIHVDSQEYMEKLITVIQ